jgi:phage terminase small subunit
VEETQTTSKGEIVGTRLKPHPAVKMLSEASLRLQKLGHALGITPQARERSESTADVATPTGNAVLALRERLKG